MDLKGFNEVRKITLSAPLGDSGATVTYAEISPISVYVTYDFPLQMEEIECAVVYEIRTGSWAGWKISVDGGESVYRTD